MKRTYQPNNRRRKMKHGFRARMATKNGQATTSQGTQATVCLVTSRRYPKRVRLCGRSEVARIFQHGNYRGLGLISIKYLASSGSESRFLVTVSKRVGHAPLRNRLKRLLREATH